MTDNANIIAQDTVKNFLISTVKLSYTGLDDREFETMVFDTNQKTDYGTWESLGEEVYCNRYRTIEAAKKGHNETLKKYEDQEGRR